MRLVLGQTLMVGEPIGISPGSPDNVSQTLGTLAAATLGCREGHVFVRQLAGLFFTRSRRTFVLVFALSKHVTSKLYTVATECVAVSSAWSFPWYY